MGDWKNRFSTLGLGRALFGGVLAFMALDNFRDLEGSIGWSCRKAV
ncbi:hypothetical protein [Halococcus thailandensis]|nr:hypothetical protein [Halococcus thailandensis]